MFQRQEGYMNKESLELYIVFQAIIARHNHELSRESDVSNLGSFGNSN